MNENFKLRLQKVRCFIFDVDGVLTNNSIIVMPGELYRIMNIRDGFGLKTAVEKGYHVIIISGGKSESVRTRLQNLGLKDVFLGIENKIIAYEEVKTKYNLENDEILYMGDDVPDYDVMKINGIPTCPFDAVADIRSLSVYISPLKGGEGCVRDVIEQTLRLQGNWPV